MSDRPAIPMETQRKVLIEAGHRCAIPTCRHPTTEFAHIIPRRDTQDDDFSNLIALCPNCHTRYDHGEIDRKSIQIYKNNLSLLNGRYSDSERRVLSFFIDNPNERKIKLPYEYGILLKYLVDDGIIKLTDKNPGFSIMECCPIAPPFEEYELTPEGSQFINEIIDAREIE